MVMIKQYKGTIILAVLVLVSGSFVYAQIPEVTEQVIEQEQTQQQVETPNSKYPDGIYNENRITPELREEAKFLLKKDQATYEITRRLDRIIELLEQK